MSDNQRGLTLEERQPPYEDLSKQPRTLTRTRHIDGVLYVAGRAPVENQEHYDIMVVTVSLEEDEAVQHAQSTFGFRVMQQPEYLKGANGIVKDVALRAGIDLDTCYYTAICKWLLPRTQRSKPPKKILNWGMPVLEDEIKRVTPKIIVCMGKLAFDALSDQKIKFDDAHGCWFWSERFQAHLYVMRAPYALVGKPEYYETFRIDFKEIKHRKDLLDAGLSITGSDVKFQVLRNMDDLEDWLSHIEDQFDAGIWPGHLYDDGNPILSGDGEWHGMTHVDGKLRTFQFAWSETEAVVIEFRDEQTEWSFDCGEEEGTDLQTPAILAAANEDDRRIARLYAVIGARLKSTFERIKVCYIGHHFAADAPWMQYWLGLETYGRCVMDTEFAQQTVDESSELGLERGIAMKYTTLGRYDRDLVMWKRDNKAICEDGYGFIPSAILHPYGALDVVTPLRAYPLIRRQMAAQRLWDYYKNVFNPFVTDVFTEFCMVGLPMDIPTMDDLRVMFSFARDKLSAKLQLRIAAEARAKLRSRILLELGIPALREITPHIDSRNEEALRNAIKSCLSAAGRMGDVIKWNSLILHFIEAPAFNIRSADQMRRWLFDVEGLTPIKSTNQKAKGLPSMAWEKVLELPKDRQSQFTPAVDKQTLQILAQKSDTLDELLDLNAVGNLAKAFLKEPDVYIDEDTGEEVREENGLHAWLCSDERVHGQTSTTETGRSRSWRPNVLNWPSYVNKRIARSVSRIIKEAHEEGDLPEALFKWLGVDGDALPSIRSCVKAPPGYVLVESDYATAEMVALAEISGDKDLRRILHDPDPEWARLKGDNPYKAKAVRISYDKKSAIPQEAQDPRCLMHVWDSGECLGPVTEDMLVRDADGKIKCAKYDIHWSLAEATYGKPREMMKAKIQRNAAKVINFSSAYGASAASLERKIEADTGVKPEPGTGDKGLEAIMERQPRATEFLEEMAAVPKGKGYYRAASGRIRHCILHGAGSGVGWRIRNSLESAMGRELRNFPMQESVGATSARACRWLMSAYRRFGMKARVMTCLYDSVVTLCPLEERFLVGRLHQICMSELNTWDYEDEYGKRTLKYTIDNEFNWRWSTRPPEEEQTLLDSREWCPPSAKWQALEKHPGLSMLARAA